MKTCKRAVSYYGEIVVKDDEICYNNYIIATISVLFRYDIVLKIVYRRVCDENSFRANEPDPVRLRRFAVLIFLFSSDGFLVFIARSIFFFFILLRRKLRAIVENVISRLL